MSNGCTFCAGKPWYGPNDDPCPKCGKQGGGVSRCPAYEVTELWIDGPLPSMNDLIAAAKGYGGRGIGYARLKKQWSDTVWALAKQARLRRQESPVAVSFLWREPHRRRDIDNVAGGGCKAVLDGLVKAGVLAGDGWADVVSIEHRFQVDPKKPGVLVTIGPAVPF